MGVLRVLAVACVGVGVCLGAGVGPGGLAGSWAMGAASQERSDGVTVARFDGPWLFGYLAWQKDVATAEGGGLRIRASDSKGGGGNNVTVDLSSRAGECPVLVVEVLEGNRAKALRVMLRSAGGGSGQAEASGTWVFDLSGVPVGEQVAVFPVDGGILSDPPVREKTLDLAKVSQVQIQGDWSANPVDVRVYAVEVRPASAEARQQREAFLKREAERALAERKAKDDARKAIKHTEAGVQVEHAGLVAPDILAVALIDGVRVRSALEPYAPQPGDEIHEEGKVWVDEGGVVKEAAEKRTLVRVVNGSKQEVGLIGGGRDGALSLWKFESRTGERLEEKTVDDVTSYRVVSADDPNYAGGKAPLQVFRKSKPIDRAYPTDGKVVRHGVYLKLPTPLVEGKSYTLEFPGVNTTTSQVGLKLDTRSLWSEAIHVQQAGYRPDDPYKRAFLSIWLGTGGGYTYRGVERFELLDESGKTVFTGTPALVLAEDGKEKMRTEKNYAQTAVLALDFSAFAVPGTYRVHVPGVGVSWPVVIGEKVWEAPFRASMHGFLTQRSGIAIGPPFTTYVRGRNMHPGDGVRVFKSTTSLESAYTEDGGGDWFAKLVRGRTETVNPDAWGGYHDAGDFDRAANHLWATYLHLELYDLFPEYFAGLSLSLPENEAKDRIPDVLNEALWNLDCFRRLQEPDGGVSGGIESSAHPRPGEASTNDSLLLMTFAPDVASSYTYATVAARAGRVLAKHDAAMAKMYAESARRAWDFAERGRGQSSGAGYQSVPLEDVRNVAAAEMLMLTGEAAFDAVFRETTKVQKDGWIIDQLGGAFTYARLPKGVGDEALKAAAKAKILAQADAALNYGSGNAFGLTVEIRDMPLIGPVGAFTTPGMVSQVLPRAHYLSGLEKYLAGAVRATQFPLGANPDNTVMTTGVGVRAASAPLHIDSRKLGQDAPAGLTVYGAYDPESIPGFTQASEWVHIWQLGNWMTPPSRTWPPAEGYVDLYLWPMMNEFTIRQNMGPTSYWWGYLAARK